MSTDGRKSVTFGVNFDSDACSEHTSVQSIRRFRACAGSSIHKFRLYTGSSVRHFKACNRSENETFNLMTLKSISNYTVVKLKYK